MKQSQLSLDVDTTDIESVAAAVAALGKEWDEECKEAHERGLFDTDRDHWIAQGIKDMIRKWVPATRYHTTLQLDNALAEIDGIARDYDKYECGLPLDSYITPDMRQALVQQLNLKVQE